jgi:molybdate transport system ATP-binding protein
MSVEDNLLFGWRRASARADAGEIARIVDLLGLKPLLARRPRHLSGGEKQRVAFGRALLAAPELLLLDEPMASLDGARRAEVLPYLEGLRDEAGLPMLYVSHAVDEVARLADEIVFVRGGRVAAQGPIFELLPALDPASGGLFRATVVRHRDDGLSELAFEGGTLLVRKVAREAGAALRVRIAAQDIMLAREEPRSISANNVLPATILSIGAGDGSQADVAIGCGPTKLTARITPASVQRLGLASGMAVFAIIKSVTVDPQLGDLPD